MGEKVKQFIKEFKETHHRLPSMVEVKEYTDSIVKYRK